MIGDIALTDEGTTKIEPLRPFSKVFFFNTAKLYPTLGNRIGPNKSNSPVLVAWARRKGQCWPTAKKLNIDKKKCWNLGVTKVQNIIFSLLVQSSCACSPILPLHFPSSFVTEKYFQKYHATENNFTQILHNWKLFHYLLMVPLSVQSLHFHLLSSSLLWRLWCCTF